MQQDSTDHLSYAHLILENFSYFSMASLAEMIAFVKYWVLTWGIEASAVFQFVSGQPQWLVLSVMGYSGDNSEASHFH